VNWNNTYVKITDARYKIYVDNNNAENDDDDNNNNNNNRNREDIYSGT
jgi:hypothetical protein